MAQTLPRQHFDVEDAGTERPDGSLPSMETLQLVTDPTRRAIVMTLWTAEDTPLRFTTLRRRSGTEESARFNYHLQQLLGRCVRDTENGYELTAHGERFIAAMCTVPTLDRSAQ